MTILDDLRQAATSAISAGATAARGQGTALRGDFENLVKPQLDDILIRIADIASDFIATTISKQQAQDDLVEQYNRVEPVILGASELLLEAGQVIINAVLDALKTAVNAAVGVALI
jgi:hypothetical protein